MLVANVKHGTKDTSQVVKVLSQVGFQITVGTKSDKSNAKVKGQRTFKHFEEMHPITCS